jgi:hypothetical protein
VTLADRIRRAALGASRRALGCGRPGVELVRVAPPMPPPAPRPLRALPAPEHPLCPRCRTRHEPRPHPAGGGGMAAAYGRTIRPDPTRPEPLNRQADETLLVLRRHRPWTP